MRRNLTILALGLVLVGTTVLSGCVNRAEINPTSQESTIIHSVTKPGEIIKYPVTKYTSTSSQYLINGNAVRYLFDEYEQITNDGLSIEAKKCCLDKVMYYIYTWPGYKYERITGSIRPYNSRDVKNANVQISLRAYGLSSDVVATEIGKNYGDSYDFKLSYDEITNECKIVTMHVFNWIVPKEIYNNAIQLALEHPVVQDYIRNTEQYDIGLEGWIDNYKGRATNGGESLNRIDFKMPVKGVIIFLFRTRNDLLYVYVDLFYGEAFTEGPMPILIR